MLRSILCLLSVLHLLSASCTDPASARTAFAMKTGILLRTHVVAQDDTEEMQRIKGCVRDAVQASYCRVPADPGETQLVHTRRLLPQLTEAAETAALQEGFDGEVSVSVESCAFDERTLDGLTIPAGDYPALMIRLGEAKGHNWWGLLDPAMSLRLAAEELQGDATLWDWSMDGFLRAVLALLPGEAE